MSLGKTLLLGFIAGVTILLGLPLGRLHRPAPTLRMMLNGIAVGILLFLLWDVLSAAWEPIDAALGDFHAGDGRLGSAFGYGLLFAGGVSAGLLVLVAYERWMDRVAGTPGADPRLGDVVARAPTRVVDRGWYRSAQLRGGLGHRSGGREQRDRARDSARGRIRVAQRDRRLRDRRAAGERDQRRRHAPDPELGIPAVARCDRRRADVHRYWDRTRVHRRALAVLFLSLAAGSIIYVVIQLLGVAAKTKRRGPSRIRPAARIAGGVPHRRNRHRRRRVSGWR